MSRMYELIAMHGGAIATHELHRHGFTRERIRIATREGELRRIRQGWYIHPDTPAAVADAFRVGGRASCVTVIQQLGLWLAAPPRDVHVAVRPNACQLRDPGDYRTRMPGGEVPATLHWSDDGGGESRLTVELDDALHELARCQGAEAAFIAAESAMAAGLLTRSRWLSICRELPTALGAALVGATAGSGSITETVFTFRSRRLGLRIRRQVQIGPDRVDFVLGDRLVVEIDSREFHERERDYARDARLGARGYRVLRFSYRQVMHDWASVEAALLAAIRRGDAA